MFYKAFLMVVFVSTITFANSSIKNLNSFQSKFIQIVTSSNSKDFIEYKGEVFIKKSGKILWKYETPVRKNIYIDNSSVIVDEPDLEQAIFTKLEQEINIIKLLEDSKKISENLYKSRLDGVDYEISIKDGKVSLITYKDNLENSIEIRFFEVINNAFIDDSKFLFVVPKDYDLIRK